MTRRIILAILVCVWAAMLVAGLTAYFATREVLLRELDARLIARASTLPEMAGATGITPDQDDRYLIRGKTGQVVRRTSDVPTTRGPQVLAAQFATLGDGRSYRSLTLRFARPDTGDDVTVVYSGPAEGFNTILKRLAMWLCALGLLGSATAAGVASLATRAALRPLREVASVVGQIDERNLARRIDVDLLPEELTLVGQRLNEMLGRLEQHADQRQQFLANASHELRTPVTALLTTLQVHLNRRQADATALRRVLEQCLGDTRLLRSLVERLMSQVRSDSTAEPAVEEVDLVELIQQCINVARGLALEKQLTVDSDLPASLVVRTEPERIRRICLNLLSNAVAYNVDQGRITVSLNPDDTNVVLRVADTGIGIAAENLTNVFSPFFRVDHARAPADHLGLGLFQVKTDVSAINGHCEIKSDSHRGTTVTVHFPLSSVQKKETATVPLNLAERMISQP